MKEPDVRWHDDSLSTGEALRRHVAELRGIRPDEVSTGQLCLHCGSSEHGQPWARLASGKDVSVSASHAGGHLVTAVADDGWVGVDIEVVADVDKGWDADLVLFHDDSSEQAGTPEERAAVWAGKEAVLKATGLGLAIPMSHVRLADWQVSHPLAPEGVICAVAVLDPDAV